ncbi:MAG: hypothetical protein KDI02_27010 [Anaerolineae bacterium]|nr:hypothetical protein [Anaerolineae bacterium]
MSVTPTSPNHPQVEYAPLVDPLPLAPEAVLVDLAAGFRPWPGSAPSSTNFYPTSSGRT